MSGGGGWGLGARAAAGAALRAALRPALTTHPPAHPPTPTHSFNDGGIPFEPFHLRREREEGYFDYDGCYVEYRDPDEEADAWLDALPGRWVWVWAWVKGGG